MDAFWPGLDLLNKLLEKHHVRGAKEERSPKGKPKPHHVKSGCQAVSLSVLQGRRGRCADLPSCSLDLKNQQLAHARD